MKEEIKKEKAKARREKKMQKKNKEKVRKRSIFLGWGFSCWQEGVGIPILEVFGS